MPVSIAIEPVIGMEVHAELLTTSKMFCGCKTTFGAPANTQCCPVCTGLPGSFPVPNRAAIDHVLRTALALGCRINRHSIFHRKNYFYPDLPKAYQISQYDIPIGEDGHLDITVNGEPRRIRIHRVHLEEDTGKLLHVERDTTFVDYNRSGVPLMEVVSEPDLHSADEAREYLMELRRILIFTGVSDGRMAEGSLRCEPNISVRFVGDPELGTKVEIKNLNSFRVVQLGSDYEIKRQSAALRAGEPLVQETRRWDDEAAATVPMRTKESAHDYRYFPEPDLIPLHFDDDWIERLRASLPELPAARRRRYTEEAGLAEYVAGVLTEERELSDYFDAAVAAYDGEPLQVANWMQSDFLRLVNAEGVAVGDVKVQPKHLAELLKLRDEGAISGKIAKSVFETMFETGQSPAEIVEEQGLTQIGAADDLAPVVEQVIAANARIVEDYRNGEVGKINFLVGQVMRETRGRANPKLVQDLLRERLDA